MDYLLLIIAFPNLMSAIKVLQKQIRLLVRDKVPIDLLDGLAHASRKFLTCKCVVVNHIGFRAFSNTDLSFWRLKMVSFCRSWTSRHGKGSCQRSWLA